MPCLFLTKPFSLTKLGTLSKVAVHNARYYAVSLNWTLKGRRSVSHSSLANSMPRRSLLWGFFRFIHFMLNICKILITHKSTRLPKKKTITVFRNGYFIKFRCNLNLSASVRSMFYIGTMLSAAAMYTSIVLNSG